MQAYFELSYRRVEDRVPVVLVATLPSIRAIAIGGSPTELRLPGVAPDVVFATVSFGYDHFHIEPRPGQAVLLNDAALDESGGELHEGDVVRIGDFQLAFHEGEPSPDTPLAETPLRWKLRSSGEGDRETIDEPSRPYIEEFQLSIRPLIQADRHAEILRMAEAELTRLTRSDDAETLETYNGFLWWLRVRSARESEHPKALEFANLAMDLHPRFAPLMVACGVSFLRAHDWTMAQSLFERVFSESRRELLLSVHDGRIGRLLAEHFSQHPDAGFRPADQWRPRDWDVPELKLHTPGDEWLLWRIARFAHLFGDPDYVRFVYRGRWAEKSTIYEDVQRWEIVNARGGLMARRLLRVPSVSTAEPSLVLEVNAIRSTLESEDRGLNQAILDLSHRPEEETPPEPIMFHQSALDVLPKAQANQVLCVRIWCEQTQASQRRLFMDVVRQPSPGDVVYQQGVVRVAVAESDSQRLAGSQLFFEGGRKPMFYVELPGGNRVVAHVSSHLASTTRRRRRFFATIESSTGAWILMLLALILLALVNILRTKV